MRNLCFFFFFHELARLNQASSSHFYKYQTLGAMEKNSFSYKKAAHFSFIQESSGSRHGLKKAVFMPTRKGTFPKNKNFFKFYNSYIFL